MWRTEGSIKKKERKQTEDQSLVRTGVKSRAPYCQHGPCALGKAPRDSAEQALWGRTASLSSLCLCYPSVGWFKRWGFLSCISDESYLHPGLPKKLDKSLSDPLGSSLYLYHQHQPLGNMPCLYPYSRCFYVTGHNKMSQDLRVTSEAHLPLMFSPGFPEVKTITALATVSLSSSSGVWGHLCWSKSHGKFMSWAVCSPL